MFTERNQLTRPTAVAGQFYPGDPGQLADMVNAMLDAANAPSVRSVKALIAPHAGYIYSGPIAASVYRTLRSQAASTSRVILLGPSHHVGFQGLATSSASYFHTPLGDVELDRELIDRVSALPQVQELDSAHAREHCLEVQLPFLQKVLNDFKLVPIVVGDCSPEQVAEVLEMLWGDENTLLVISSDLSHYQTYEQARAQDRATSQAILDLDPQRIQYHDACGRNPINGLLVAARRHRLEVQQVDLRNSGDTAGSRDRVVGYGAYLFSVAERL